MGHKRLQADGWLFDSHDPSIFLEKIEAEAERLRPKYFLSNRNAKILREAWIAGKAGTLLGVSSVVMSQQDPPDAIFQLRSGPCVAIEITELLQEGRKRGDEPARSSELRPVPEKDAAEAISANRKWIDATISKKLRRDSSYPQGTVLLIYHNTNLLPWKSLQVEIERELECCAARHGNNIAGCLILYSGSLYGKRTLASLTA